MQPSNGSTLGSTGSRQIAHWIFHIWDIFQAEYNFGEAVLHSKVKAELSPGIPQSGIICLSKVSI